MQTPFLPSTLRDGMTWNGIFGISGFLLAFSKRRKECVLRSLLVKIGSKQCPVLASKYHMSQGFDIGSTILWLALLSRGSKTADWNSNWGSPMPSPSLVSKHIAGLSQIAIRFLLCDVYVCLKAVGSYRARILRCTSSHVSTPIVSVYVFICR